GLIMALIYRKEEKVKADNQLAMPDVEEARPFWQTALHFFILVAILVFVNWGKPDTAEGFWYEIFASKWFITSIFGIGFALSMAYIIKLKKLFVLLGTIAVIISAIIFYENPTITFVVAVAATTIALTFSEDEPNQWLGETWGFTKQIMPLLGAGVLVAVFLFGSSDGSGGIVPNEWIANLVGGLYLFSIFFVPISVALMYFVYLQEISYH